MNPESQHPCPCCGYRTYLLPAGGTMQLCPVCFWEDSPGTYPYNGSNQVSPLEGQRNFAEFGACERRYRNAVRVPLPEDNRSPHWMSIDDFRERMISLVEEAFSGVKLDGGCTLHQMDVYHDYYGDEELLLEARLKDPETRWQQIPAEKLSRFYESMTFLDSKGFRFYLPAFMRHALATSAPGHLQDESDGVIYALWKGPENSSHADGIKLLTPAQLQCAAAFLHYFARLTHSIFEGDTHNGLENGWDQWTPDFVRLSLL